MSLKHFVHKAVKSVKKQVRRLGSRDGWTGKKHSALNPWAEGLHIARSVARGVRHKRWQRNVAKYTQGGSRSVSLPYSYTVGGSSGGEYVHDSRTLSQLTGGA